MEMRTRMKMDNGTDKFNPVVLNNMRNFLDSSTDDIRTLSKISQLNKETRNENIMEGLKEPFRKMNCREKLQEFQENGDFNEKTNVLVNLFNTKRYIRSDLLKKWFKFFNIQSINPSLDNTIEITLNKFLRDIQIASDTFLKDGIKFNFFEYYLNRMSRTFSDLLHFPQNFQDINERVQWKQNEFNRIKNLVYNSFYMTLLNCDPKDLLMGGKKKKRNTKKKNSSKLKKTKRRSRKH